jgi:small nuclear ribonucleoprotein (snRNP)-like protein
MRGLISPVCHHSFFKTLVDHEVTVELKNDVSIKGTLKSVDQFLNIKLEDITVVDELKYPHLVSFAMRESRGRRVMKCGKRKQGEGGT